MQADVKHLQEQLAALKRRQAAVGYKQLAADIEVREPASEEQPLAKSGAAGLRAIRRMTSLSGQRSASAAASLGQDEDDPLTRPYYLLNMRQGQLSSATSNHLRQPQQQGMRQRDGQVDEDEEAVVLLEDVSDEQLDSGSWSEVESDGSDGRHAQQTAAPGRHLQNAAPTQQNAGAAGSSLGKREQAGAGSSRHGGRGGSPNENLPEGNHGVPLLAAAGPGRLAMQHAPGKSFIRNAAVASIGIDRGKYISSGPDGKGGVTTAYKNGGSLPTRVGGLNDQLLMMVPYCRLGTLVLLQYPCVIQPLMCSLQMASSKKARVGGSGAAVPITSFFSRAQQ